MLPGLPPFRHWNSLPCPSVLVLAEEVSPRAWCQGAHTGLPVQPQTASYAGAGGGVAQQVCPRSWSSRSRGLPRGGRGEGHVTAPTSGPIVS